MSHPDPMNRRQFVEASTRMVFGAALTTGVVQTAASAETSAAAGSALGLEHVLTVRANIDPVIQMGKTPLGDRRVITISGGSFEGPKARGVIMPGGEDWQISRPDGVTELDAQYWLRTHDGVIIKVQNRAMIAPPEGNGAPYFRCAHRFEAPIGTYDWLNKAIFVGSAGVDNPTQPKVVTLQFYKLT
jgi:hypothetical protein